MTSSILARGGALGEDGWMLPRWLLVVALVSLSCTDGDSSAQIVALQAEVAAMREATKEIERLREDVEQLRSQAQSMAGTIFELEVARSSSAVLAPDSTGYGVITTSHAVFLVALQKVEPYANGYRLALRIGNPQAIEYASPTIKVTWGPPFNVKERSYEEWKGAQRSKSHHLMSSMRAGAWNEMSIVVAPAAAEEIGRIEVEIEADVVSMPVRQVAR